MRPDDLLRALERAHPMPGAACPRCQTQLDRATGVVDDDTPKAGDITICVDCEATLEYQPDLSFRSMTEAEVAALDDHVLLSLLDAIEGARMMRKAREAMLRAKQTPPRA